MEVRLLDAFAMIALGIGQAKQSLLQKRVLPVPDGEGNVLQPMGVCHSCDPVFTPTVRSRPRVVVRKMAPRITIVRVVFSNCSPLSFTQIGAPSLPVPASFSLLLQTLLLGAEVLMMVDNDLCQVSAGTVGQTVVMASHGTGSLHGDRWRSIGWRIGLYRGLLKRSVRSVTIVDGYVRAPLKVNNKTL